MLWIVELGLVTPAAAQALSAAANCLFFWRYAKATLSRARRVASTTLALLCAVLLLEAGLFLAFGWLQLAGAPRSAIFMTLLLRWALVFVTGLLSLLIVRSPLRRA